MAARKTTPPTITKRDGRTIDEHLHFIEGSPVKVRGIRGSWSWQYAWLDANGDVESYSVIGGPIGHKQWRSFSPDRVTLITPRKARKSS